MRTFFLLCHKCCDTLAHVLLVYTCFFFQNIHNVGLRCVHTCPDQRTSWNRRRGNGDVSANHTLFELPRTCFSFVKNWQVCDSLSELQTAHQILLNYHDHGFYNSWQVVINRLQKMGWEMRVYRSKNAVSNYSFEKKQKLDLCRKQYYCKRCQIFRRKRKGNISV